ncbi:MAG: DUF29 domain-containing protein [Hyphomonadaceae bacterium]|nr:DUF29 domain-containing protein [Hyphomonadaceae bacterium]
MCYTQHMSKTYEADFYSWTKEQADALKRRSANELDWDKLAEELNSLGTSEEMELGSRYVVLLTHLLKWVYQPDRRSRSWSNTITTQRRAIAKHLRRNPGLKSIEAEEYLDAYENARLEASSETDMDVGAFPEAPPFTMDQAKNADWMPE